MSASEMVMKTISSESGRVDAAMRSDLEGLAPEVDDLLMKVLQYCLFNGGKRIRPLLVVLAARICGRRDPGIYQLARAFEYLHAATLMHDDVIDNADTRRGKPAVHIRFGIVAAILTGDFLHARSMAIVGALAGSEALSVFSEAAGKMVDGEFLQMRNAACLNLSEDDYHHAILGKTGILISAACEVGAVWAGAGSEERVALREYGICLGSAFQMIDDLLDYQGDRGKTGKQVGNDLAEGKMTLPLILTVQHADGRDRARLQEIFGDEIGRREGLEEVSGLIAKYDGFALTRSRAEQMGALALSRLDLFPDETCAEEKAVLQGLVDFVLKREK
ncbi:polyprenyl synthetase family protein [Desulfoprunum benzoelyticum]|uniref:Octaprenyl-diphosphate synthase n=1 Tax=Desulfoprunum benzoelyticum TaxID=1506996 RepID=A0A840UQM9_9BACT|nr:polyprenyl synthetase family protein [Desulfoprunum benzoelyticum]MBB5347146.1 octaprenyl-diphosphate synthase [Desulfoprunum benzoelyticum]MBM9531221.1 polyprenyl synthetase family protein [Desulfoprunum benzoelyticum]